MKPRSWIIVVALLITFVATGLLLRRNSEPSYKGTKLSEWLDQGGPMFAFSAKITPEQETAIRYMGPKALPFLVDWVDSEPWLNSRRLLQILKFIPASSQTSRWRGRLMQKAQDNELRAELRAAAAAKALHLLGSDARPAIPRLIETFRARRQWYSTYRIGEVLEDFGPEALPGLLKMLSDPAFTNQIAVVEVIGRMHRLGPAAFPAVPFLCGYLGQSDARLRMASVESLAALGVCPEQAVPTLVRTFTNAMANSEVMLARRCAEAIGQFHAGAAAAVPALCSALKDSDSITTEEAARALGRIGTGPELGIPALLEYLQGQDKRHRKYAIEGLTGYGAAARPAAPLLREVLLDGDHDTRELAAALLQTLDARQ